MVLGSSSSMEHNTLEVVFSLAPRFPKQLLLPGAKLSAAQLNLAAVMDFFHRLRVPLLRKESTVSLVTSNITSDLWRWLTPTSVFQRDTHLAALYPQLDREILPRSYPVFHSILCAVHCKRVSSCIGYSPCSCIVQMICCLNDVFSQWNKMKIYGTTVIDIVQDFAALSCIITVYSYSAHATYSNSNV